MLFCSQSYIAHTCLIPVNLHDNSVGNEGFWEKGGKEGKKAK